MELLSALVELAREHSPGLVLAFFTVVMVLLMIRGAVSTWRAVWTMTAQGRSQMDRSTAGALDKLADSNTQLTQELRNLVTLYGTSMQSAQTERLDQAKVLERTLNRMEGMLSLMDDQKKAQRGMSNTLNEVADRIVPMQTDLKDIGIRTAGMESGIAKMLDERLTPMLTLLMGMNAQVNALAATAKASGQNVETIILEVAKINEATAKIISEFALFKDMIFDRDDRIADILTAFNPKEKTQ